MRFHVLGPLEVEEAGSTVDIGSARQRALLAILISRANRVVSTDDLVDLLWGDEPPEGGVRTLRFHVSKLRDALQPDRDRGNEGLIATRSPGYVLVAHSDSIDANQFEAGIEAARNLASTDPPGALGALDAALSLWRGTPYADFAYEEFARSEVVRLEELHLSAVETRLDLMLTLGRHRDVVAELKGLTEKHPLRERLWGQLMLAEYRDGRQARALDAYRRFAQRLGDELGLEPSADLKMLEERILLEDRSLLQPGPVPAVGRLRGYELLGRIGEGAFGTVWRARQPGMDREVALKVIRADLANRPEFVRRFEAEARLVASLEHPHIVTLFDFWRDPDGAYLVMPLLRGGSLGELLRTQAWDVAAARQLLDEVGSALSFAHAHGVVHRDVTPDNILLDGNGHAYLADFGVAALVGESGSVPTRSPAFVSPEQVAGEPVTPAADIYSLGVVAHAAFAGSSPETIEALDVIRSSTDFDAELAELLATAVAPQVERRPASVDAFLDELLRDREAAPAHPTSMVRNPYKGLRAFHEADAPDFFGRDGVVTELLAALSRHRLVGVVGPSGSGKSSVVRAGLIPLLRAGGLTGSDRWLIADLFPAGRPFGELASALLEVAVEEPAGLDDVISSGEGWRETVEAMLPAGHEVLLVIDQFEELFTLTEEADVQRRFLDVISGLVADGGSRVRVVVTLRADFYDRPLDHPVFGDLLRRALVSVPAPSEESLEAAVRGPANRVGVELEPGLETEIVRDVIDQPGGLPLMEYALTELFEHRVDSRMTRDAYHRSGGVLGALGRRAEEIYLGLADAARDAARSMFLRLVTVEEATEDARRRIPLEELHNLGIDREIVDPVLRAYADHRLVTFDRDPQSRAPTVEVAHEALLREWARLKGWIDGRRDDLIHHRRLAAAIAEWDESGRSDAYLLRGGRLAHFEEFTAGSDLALTENERGYVAASRAEENRTSRGRRRRRQTIMAGFGAAAVVALLLALVGFAAQRRAEENLAKAEESAAKLVDANDELIGTKGALQEALDEAVAATGEALAATQKAQEEFDRAEAERDVARIRELTAASARALVGDHDLALLLALEAVRLEPDGQPLPDAVTALRTALSGTRALATLPGRRRVSIDPTGSLVASTPSLGGPVTLWDVDTGDIEVTLPVSGDYWDGYGESAVAFNPDGSLIATGRTDGTIALWDAASGAEVATTNDLQYVWIGRDLNNVSYASYVVTDAEAPAPHAQGPPTSAADEIEEFVLVYGGFATHPIRSDASAEDVAANLEGLPGIAKAVVSGGGSETDPWRVAIQPEPGTYTQRLRSVGFRGHELAGVRMAERLYVAQADLDAAPSPGVVVAGRGHHNPIVDSRGPYSLVDEVAFSSDGRLLATWGRDDIIRVWETRDLNEVAWFFAPALVLQRSGLSFSADGSQLAAVSYDAREIWIWDVMTGAHQSLETGELLPTDVAFLNEGDAVLATVTSYSEPGIGFLVWRIGSATPTLHPDTVDFRHALAYSPSSQLVAAGGDSGHIGVWKLADGVMVNRFSLSGHHGAVWDLQFSADGHRLVSTSTQDGTSRVWDLAPGGRGEIATYDTGSHSWVDYVFDASGERLAYGLGGCTADIVDLATDAVVSLEVCGADGNWSGDTRVSALDFSPDGQYLATGVHSPSDGGGLLKVWDSTSGALVATLVQQGQWPDWVWDLEYSPDGAMLAAAGGPLVRLWSVPDYTPLKSIDQEFGNIAGIAFSPDSSTLAVRGWLGDDEEQRVVLWDIDTRRFRTCCVHPWSISAGIDFSSDGSTLATVGIDGFVRIWNSADGTMIHSWAAHDGWALGVEFSTHHDLVATTGADGYARVWAPTTGEEVLAAHHPGGAWPPVARFHPTSDWVMSYGDLDAVLRIWTLDVNELQRMALERVTRSFTSAECQIFRISDDEVCSGTEG